MAQGSLYGLAGILENEIYTQAVQSGYISIYGYTFGLSFLLDDGLIHSNPSIYKYIYTSCRTGFAGVVVSISRIITKAATSPTPEGILHVNLSFHWKKVAYSVSM